MTVLIDGPWAEYEREQTAARKRERYALTDVSGADGLDFIVEAISAGTSFNRDDIRRRRLSSARREKSQRAQREIHAAAYESDLHFRQMPSAESMTSIAQEVVRLPLPMAAVVLLDAQGHTDREIGVALGIGAAAVRQRLSRAGRRLAA